MIGLAIKGGPISQTRRRADAPLCCTLRQYRRFISQLSRCFVAQQSPNQARRAMPLGHLMF